MEEVSVLAELTFQQNHRFPENLLIADAATFTGAKKEVHVFTRICIQQKSAMMAFNDE